MASYNKLAERGGDLEKVGAACAQPMTFGRSPFVYLCKVSNEIATRPREDHVETETKISDFSFSRDTKPSR